VSNSSSVLPFGESNIDNAMDTADHPVQNLSVVVRQQTFNDAAEIDRLMGLGFSSSHSGRNIWRLREGEVLDELCLVAEAEAGHLLGSIRYWPITIANKPSILLGPLAVDPAVRGRGIGVQLVRQSLERALSGPWHWCFISGEPNYYLKFGFSPVTYEDVSLPAHIEEERLHMLALSSATPEDMPPKPWPVLSMHSFHKEAK
jgi:predicted N-acetyltransferase YhbS